MMQSKDIDHNSFFVNGQTYRLDDIVEIIGMSKEGQDIIKENDFKWILSAISGRLDKAWFTSIKTKKTIRINHIVDSTFVVFPLMEEEDL